MKKTKQPRAADSAQSLETSELIRAHLDACVDIDEERMRDPSERPCGAMRAANVILDRMEGHRISSDEIRDIIERETGAKKLLAAVIAANAIFAQMEDEDGSPIKRADVDKAYSLAQDALNAANGDAP